MATTASLSDLDDFHPRWRTGVRSSPSPYLSPTRASFPFFVLYFHAVICVYEAWLVINQH